MECRGRSTHDGSAAPLLPPPGEEEHLRRGSWTVEEDLLLMNHIAVHGEGRWNSLARCSGLRRTGKSCRLRWLNYLRPGVRRGNMTPDEQLLILQLHSRWGNQWSKIARELPGRTDNEIKNYWRTKVQKHAKQLRCEDTSEEFKNMITYLWMPRLAERIREASVLRQNTAVSIPRPAVTVPPTGELAQGSTSTENSNSGTSWSADSSTGVGVLRGVEDSVCDWLYDSEYSEFSAANCLLPEILPGDGCGSADGGSLGLLEFGRSAAGWAEGLCSTADLWLQQELLL